MSTVLVPLNETAFAESILPDAAMLVGPDGSIALVYVVPRRQRGDDAAIATEEAQRYLTNEADLLTARGFHVATRVLMGGDIPQAIDEGVTEMGADFVAVATGGMGGHERLARSSIAWKTLAHSPVPVLFRHARQGEVRELDVPVLTSVKIMVPLDGSPRAERALTVATALAAQWQGSITLAHVTSDANDGAQYLDRVATALHGSIQQEIRSGNTVGELVVAANALGITHVVMTSHGRTGLSRMIAGDVADGLIDRLSIPIIVVPAFATMSS